MPSQVMLINVEVVATPYIQTFKNYHQALCTNDTLLPDDFFENAISAAYEHKEKTNFRYPRVDLFSPAHHALFDNINHHIHPNNPTIKLLASLAAQYNYDVAFIFDQMKKQGQQVATALCAHYPHAVAFFGDQSVLGKPEPHLYLRAIKHFNVHPNQALVIDSTRNGILAAHLAQARSVYINHGLGLSERIVKYATYHVDSLSHLPTLLQHINT